MTLLEQPPSPAAEGDSDAPAIPDRLAEPLRVVAGRATLLAWFSAMFQLLALVAGVWLITALLLGSGRQLPLWLSISLTLIAWAAVIVGAVRILHTLFRRKRGLAAAALLADEALPDTEERLSSAIELSREKNPAFRGSPELVAVLLRQAEHHADNMDPGAVVSGRDVMRWLGAVALIAAIWFVLLVVLTPNMLLGMQRLLTPWTSASALPSPVIVVKPGDAVLAQGDSLEITAEIKPPDGVSLDNGNQQIDSATLVRHFLSSSGTAASPDVSADMERTGLRTFRVDLQNIQQAFSYQIFADGGKKLGRGQSPPFTVTVQIRPAVADVEVQYTYPAYTHLDPRTVHSHDGAIEAVIGTRAKVTIHTTEPVKSATLQLDDDGYGALKTPPLLLVSGTPTGNGMGVAAYAAEFPINKSTHYRVKLTASDGRDNPDQDPRSINALADNPPQVQIKLPDPTAGTLQVKPDDNVPMRVLATDDFGITKIEAVVQVDDRPPQTLPVSTESGDTDVTRDWNLDLRELLVGMDRVGPPPRRIGYQFKATDNRDPGPQEGFSAKEYLQLNANAPPIAQRLDSAAVKGLGDAIAQATQSLKQAQAEMDTLQKSAAAPSLSPQDQQHLNDAQQELAQARNTLDQAADQSDASRVGALAKKVRDVADGNVKSAQEQAARVGLAADQPAARSSSEAAAQDQIRQALEKLSTASQDVGNTSKSQPLAQALERLADEQRQLADELAQNPHDPALQQKQADLQKQLDQVVKDHPELQKSAEQGSQKQVGDLVQRVRDLEREQQPLVDQANRINDAAGASDQAKDLAARQQTLNQDIAKFAGDQAPALQSAGNAKTPDASKLDPIVKDLKQGQFDDAAREGRAAASALDQTADQLGAAQKASDDNSGPREKRAQQAAQDAQAASELQKQAGDLQKQIQDATDQHNPPTRPGDPSNRTAAELANQIKQTAARMESAAAENSAAKSALQQAGKSADAARTQAQQGQAQNAQRDLQQAADSLAQAAQAEQSAAGGPAQNSAAAGTNPQSPAISNSPAASAGVQARTLADRQRDLAAQADRLSQDQRAAADSAAHSAATARDQQDMASRINDAARAAQDLKNQTQGPAPQLSQKIAQAQQALQQASDSQKGAADSASQQNAAQSAAAQNDSANHLAQAEQALTGQQPNSANASSASQSAAGRDVQSARDSQSQAMGGNPSAAQSAASALTRAAQEIAGNGQNSKPGDNSANNSSQPQSADSGNGSGQRGGSQNAGNPSPGDSNSAGQNPRASGQTASGQKGGSQSGAGQSNSGQPGNSGGQPGAGGQGAGTSGGAAAGAGQGGAGNPGAGSSGSSGSAGAGNGSAGGSSGAAGGSGSGGGSGTGGQAQGNGASGSGSGSGQSQGTASSSGGGGGIQITMNARNTDEPKDVKDVGISPSDWGRLPQQMQDELIHSAQQPGPPGYRDMIKNYYSRIARMQAQGEGAP